MFQSVSDAASAHGHVQKRTTCLRKKPPNYPQRTIPSSKASMMIRILSVDCACIAMNRHVYPYVSWALSKKLTQVLSFMTKQSVSAAATACKHVLLKFRAMSGAACRQGY